MRHACSELNEKCRALEGGRDAYLDLDLDRGNRDAKLSSVGIQEALKQRELIRALRIRKIMVSPMRRAVETAILAVTGLRLGVEIELTPILREQITFKNTVCSSLTEIKEYVADLETRISEGRIDIPELSGDVKSEG